MAWRIPLIAAIAVLACRMLLSGATLPGTGGALFAVAMLLALRGWAFHATGDRRMRSRRDAFLGLSLGIMLAVLSSFVW